MREFAFQGKTFKVECVETFPQHPSWFTFVDEDNVRDRDWQIEPGDVVLDVGAAYGSYALTALSEGASFVYAWSPQGQPGEAPERDFLMRSAALNGWQDKVQVYDSGCFSKAGWVNTGSQAFYEEQPEPNWEIIRVEPLDDWFGREKPARVDWMKLDVEGAEVEVLQGAKTLIEFFHPIILVENHAFKRASIADEVRDLLITRGYAEVSRHPHHAVSHSVYRPAV